MKIRKAFASLLTALAITASFPAALAENTVYTPNPELDANAELTLTLYGPGLFATTGENGSIDLTSGITTPGYNEVVSRWNEFYPNVKLDIQAIPWSDWQANVTTAVMSGDIDIILHGATLATLCDDLQPYIDKSGDYLSEIYLVASRYTADAPAQPKVSGLPYTVTPMLVYLDSDIFAHYSVELPSADWTWEDLLALAEKLTGTDPVTGEQTYGFKFPSRTASNNFYFNHMMLAQAYGGNIIHYADTLKDITADYHCESSTKAFEMIQKLSAYVSPDCREGVTDDNVLASDNNVAIRIDQNPFAHYAEAQAADALDRFVWQTLPCAMEGEGNIAAAKKARCYDFVMALPDGFDTVIGEGGASLSGGERQLISIARAIMKDAPIIILDEATANVDPENEKELMEAVGELTHDKTVIMIAHRLKTVRNADQIFVVDGGRIVQQGTHDELVAQDGLYRRFVVERRQAAGWKV